MAVNNIDLSADLHIHTNFSDSTLSPEQVVEYAGLAGLRAMAITDHDVVEGIPAVTETARGRQLEIVAGVELTAEIEDKEIHILGYFIDYTQPWFLQKLKAICQVRNERIYLIVDKLSKMGVQVQADDILEYAGHGSVGRMHVAQVMVNKGCVDNLNEAFSKYIGNKAPAYVKKYSLSPAEAIELIRRVKGVPVLAHPYITGQDEYIPDFVKSGLMGIEAFHTTQPRDITQHYIETAQKYGLVVTGGSDCHGMAKGEVLIGRVKVDYQVVEQLRALSGGKGK